MQRCDLIVIGGGIVGAAVAHEAGLAGLRVALVEAAIPGSGASGAGMGHVVAMDDSPAQLALSAYSRQLWRTLHGTLPDNVEYQERGTIWVAADQEEMAEVHRKRHTYEAAGMSARVLTSRMLAEVEPQLRPGFAGALLVEHDSVVYPPTATRFFLESAVSSGALLLRGQAAVSAQGGEVILEDGARLRAARIVIATGIDRRLTPCFPVQGRKGHLVITERYPGFVQHQIVELGYLKSAHELTADSVAFNIQPRRTGQLLIGSSRQYGREDAAADHAILRQMLQRAQAYMPGLATVSAVRVWTGFRAATPDKLPYIGATQDPTVFLAIGFEGLGITNAPGAARLLIDQILGRAPEIDPTPYFPGRVCVTECANA